MQYQKSDQVACSLGNGEAEGEVRSVFHEKTARKINGNEVASNGSKDDRALSIEQDGGTDILKLASEVEPK